MPRISAATIEAVSGTADIVALIGNYTHLEQRGSNWWGCCPFHNEKTPSFNVVPDKKMFYCFGCNKGGSIINFLMEIEHLSFMEAVETLAKRNGIEIVYDGNIGYEENDSGKNAVLELYNRVANSFYHILVDTGLGRRAKSYLEKRSVSQEIIDKFKLGYSPKNRKWLYSFLKNKAYSDGFLETTGLFSKNYKTSAFFSDRIMFPICDRYGQVVAFGGRILSGDGPKYLNSSDMPQYKKGETLFAFHHALSEIRKQKSVIICEGYMDVLAFHQAGICNAVAPLGTALTEAQIKILKSFAPTFFLAFDSDEAGQNAAYKSIKLCRAAGINTKILDIHGGKDPAEIFQKEGREGLHLLLKSAIFDDDYLIQIAAAKFDINNPDGKTKGIAFLFPYIDALESDIQKESVVDKLSSLFGISQKSILKDYRSRNVSGAKYIINELTIKKERKPLNIKRNAELRSVLAVAANPMLFPRMRSELNPEDFENPFAKDLFIVLEECYRADANTYDNLLLRCANPQLRNLISEAVVNGEFANNSNQIIEDGIKLIKQNILQKQRNNIIGRLRLLYGKNSVDDVNLTNELMAEKQMIDEKLAALRGRSV